MAIAKKKYKGLMVLQFCVKLMLIVKVSVKDEAMAMVSPDSCKTATPDNAGKVRNKVMLRIRVGPPSANNDSRHSREWSSQSPAVSKS